MIIFDIETGPLNDEQLRELLPPFDESSFLVGKFDESTIKCGNIKDPAKIKEKIDSAREAHEARRINAGADCVAAKVKHWEEFRAGAALSATTGQVICIAYYSPGKDKLRIDGVGDVSGFEQTERDVIALFWSTYASMRLADRRMVGLNILGFDLPFLVRRSWLLGISYPPTVLETWKHRVTWSDTFLDLRSHWLLGEHPNQVKSSFATLAAAFGTGGKTPGASGAEFARLWEEDRELAVEYVSNDVKQPAEWVRRMNLLG